MNLLQVIKRANSRVRRKGLLDTVGVAWNISTGLADYYLNPFALTTGKLPPRNWPQIRAEMEQADLQVVPYRINVPAFRDWLERAAFPDYYVKRYGKVFVEKALEHYVGADLLGLSPGQVFIDVAASSSPWLNIAPRLYGVMALALDLHPPTATVPGYKLAADATHMPLPDNSVDGMALHCAYEMFEGDADSRLIPEAARVLREGGRMVILPLYMHHLYYADSSPGADRRGIDYQGAKRVWREDRDGRVGLGGVRFSRKYDVPAFLERVVPHRGPLRLTIRYIENETEVDPICYLALIFVSAIKAQSVGNVTGRSRIALC